MRNAGRQEKEVKRGFRAFMFSWWRATAKGAGRQKVRRFLFNGVMPHVCHASRVVFAASRFDQFKVRQAESVVVLSANGLFCRSPVIELNCPANLFSREGRKGRQGKSMLSPPQTNLPLRPWRSWRERLVSAMCP